MYHQAIIRGVLVPCLAAFTSHLLAVDGSISTLVIQSALSSLVHDPITSHAVLGFKCP